VLIDTAIERSLPIITINVMAKKKKKKKKERKKKKKKKKEKESVKRDVKTKKSKRVKKKKKPVTNKSQISLSNPQSLSSLHISSVFHQESNKKTQSKKYVRRRRTGRSLDDPRYFIERNS